VLNLTVMSQRTQEPDLGLSIFMGFFAAFFTFLITGLILVYLFVALGWLDIQLCFGGPCPPPDPLKRWSPYVILLTAGCFGAFVFAKIGNWVLRNATRNRAG
jgi:hypothetical protein